MQRKRSNKNSLGAKAKQKILFTNSRGHSKYPLVKNNHWEQTLSKKNSPCKQLSRKATGYRRKSQYIGINNWPLKDKLPWEANNRPQTTYRGQQTVDQKEANNRPEGTNKSKGKQPAFGDKQSVLTTNKIMRQTNNRATGINNQTTKIIRWKPQTSTQGRATCQKDKQP